MKKLIFTFALFSACLVGVQAIAASYTLTYQKTNRWVAVEDGKPLRALIKEAKAKKANHFNVILPLTKREISIERLVILRNILEKSLGTGVIIEEVRGEPTVNAIIVSLAQ